MQEDKFKIVLICSQKKSLDAIEAIEELKLDYDLLEKRALAPVSPEVVISIVVSLAQLLPIVLKLVKKLRERDAFLEFETRHELAKKMLQEFEPLIWLKGKDSKDYSYYEFKTSKCRHYWELDRGEISFGGLGCP